MYIGSRAVNLLVDSGAQVTMCSKVIYDSLAPSCRPTLTSCGQPISAANGGHITTYGTAIFPLSVAGTLFSTEIIVADMGGIPGVLGMDFLAQNNAVLHCFSGKIEIASRVVNCHERRPDEGGQVALSEAAVLLPGHVCYVNVDFDRWGGSSRL